MNPFVLTENHKKYGLANEEFAHYAGFNSPAFSLDDFPYGNALIAGQTLSETKRVERSISILDALIHANITFDINGARKELTAIKLTEASTCPSPTVVPWRSLSFPLTCAPEQFFQEGIPTFHFQTIIQNGLDATDHPLSMYDGFSHVKNRFVVLPGLLSEKLPSLHLALKTEAFVLRAPAKATAADCWSRHTGIPLDRLANFPDDGAHRLSSDLHELRHLLQIKAVTGDVMLDSICVYYTEADSDLFTLHTLKKANFGHKTQQAIQHTRYIDILRGHSDHWIAPLVDAITTKKKPPTFYDVYFSGFEITTRLCLEAMGQKHKHINSRQFKRALFNIMRKNSDAPDRKLQETIITCTNIYNKWSKQQLDREPEVFYSLLKRLVRKGIFTNLLTNYTAKKIVAAAEAFNPALTKELRPETKARLPYIAGNGL